MGMQSECNEKVMSLYVMSMQYYAMSTHWICNEYLMRMWWVCNEYAIRV